MARVLFYTGISLLCVSAALLYLPACFSFILIGLLVGGLTVAILLRKRIRVRGLKTLLVITLAFAIFGTVTIQTQVRPAEQLAGHRAYVVATVQNWPTRTDSYSVYELKTESIKIFYKTGERHLKTVPQRVKLRVSDVHESDLSVFDRVAFEVQFQPLEEYRSSSFANGVYAGGYAEKQMVSLGENRPFYACFYDLRSSINQLLYHHIEYDSAALISAVLLGDRSGLSDSFETDARAAGVTHTLVVSGMHLGIIFQLLEYCLKRFLLFKRSRAVVLMGAVFALSAICGFTPSVLRAGLTYLILAGGMFFYRRPDGLNSLGAAIIIILFSSPFGFGNISFLLSALATFGLLYICPLFYERTCKLLSRLRLCNWVTKGIVYPVCQTVSATLATAPICILCFGYVSLISPLTNVLIGFAITLLLELAVLVVLLLALPMVGKAAASVGIVILTVIVRYLVWVIGLCGNADWAILPTNIATLLPWGFLMLAILLIAVGSHIPKTRVWRWWIRGGAVTLSALAVVGCAIVAVRPSATRVTVLSVGDGGSVVLEYQGQSYLIGAGDTANDAVVAERYLLTRGKRNVDALLLPDLEKPMAGGAAAMIQYLSPNQIICPASGTYAGRLQRICQDTATLFDQTARIAGEGESGLFLYRGAGAVIHTKTALFVIAVGETIQPLLETVDEKPIYLVCISKVPKDFSLLQAEKIILCGNADTVADMRPQMPQTVSVIDNSKEAFVFEE